MRSFPTNERRHPATRARRRGISGVIERVTLHNDESSFCVLRCKNNKASGNGFS